MVGNKKIYVFEKFLFKCVSRPDHSEVPVNYTFTKIRLYKLKRCSNKECCKQCRYVMFKGTMTKWPVQKLTQGTTQKLLQHHDATDI